MPAGEVSCCIADAAQVEPQSFVPGALFSAPLIAIGTSAHRTAQVPTVSHPKMSNPVVFFDINADGQPLGRIEMTVSRLRFTGCWRIVGDRVLLLIWTVLMCHESPP